MFLFMRGIRVEDKLKKIKIKHFIYIILCYTLATIIHSSLGIENNYLGALSGVVIWVILRGISDIYEKIKYPTMKEKEKQLENDERMVMIKYKAAYTTLSITLFIVAISFMVAVVKQNDELIYFISVLLITLTILMELSKYYWSRKI